MKIKWKEWTPIFLLTAFTGGIIWLGCWIFSILPYCEEQYPRDEMIAQFNSCMKLSRGPNTTHYNDQAEAIDECLHVAYVMSGRKVCR